MSLVNRVTLVGVLKILKSEDYFFYYVRELQQ